ncbi:MAG: DUF1934 domain-containing protein [Ruminococcus sp.]|nr:DUF1934 domain-containing protein [Ruminococcus sp.]
MENNRDNYLISVTGIQEVDGEQDKIELQTIGSYMVKPNHKYIGYREYDEDNPSVSSKNLVKVEDDNRVTIIRNGSKQTRLIIEKGKRHQCLYRTVMGDLMIGISAEQINNNLTDKGGNLHVKYSLDFNNEFMSKNEFFISVEEK